MAENKNMTENQEEAAAYRKRRRGCIFSIMGAWMGLLVIILLVMFLVRDRVVSREPETIIKEAYTYIDWDVPKGFEPYSITKLFGKTVLAFWDAEHVREDGRSLAVISLYANTSWNKSSLEDVEKEFKSKASDRLLENDFHVLSEEVQSWKDRSITYHFTVYTGRQRIGERLMDGSSCYLFAKGSQGIFQINTLGVESSFSQEEQIAFLKSVSAK